MPEFVEAGEADESDESNDKSTPERTVDDLPTVKIGNDELPFVEAVDTMGKMVGNPEAFGMVSGQQYRDLKNELHETRKAVAELATAVEMLSENQADIEGEGRPSTVGLEDEKMGDVYDPTDYVGGGY